MTVDVTTALYMGMSVLLTLSGLALMYPAVTGVQAVVYRRGIFALGGSALLFVAGWLTTDLVYYGLVEVQLVRLCGWVLFTLAAAVHLYAVWLFARDFLVIDQEGVVSIQVTDETGGFERDE